MRSPRVLNVLMNLLPENPEQGTYDMLKVKAYGYSWPCDTYLSREWIFVKFDNGWDISRPYRFPEWLDYDDEDTVEKMYAKYWIDDEE